MTVSRSAVKEFMARELDSWLWMKKLSREQIMAELNQLKVKPRFKTEPWLHQLVCFYIGTCLPEFLFLLDMGGGKTKIIADLITHAQRERKLEGALVMVPRIINMDSWQEDLLLHSDLEPWLCNVANMEEKWDRLAYPKGDVTIIDYAGLHMACCKKERISKSSKKQQFVRDDKKIKHLQRNYNFITMDESHKLGNHNNLWYSIVNQICKTAEFRYALTGTLFGKDPEALWAQFYLVDRGETFGENLGLFRGGFFTTSVNPWKGIQYTFDKKMEGRLHTMLQHRSIRYDETELNDLPSRILLTRTYEMGVEQKEHYLRAVQGLINAEGKLADMDANWLRMRQIISGYLAWKDDYGDHILHFKHNPKLDALEGLIDEMGDSKIIVCYDYTQTGKMITERLKAMGVDFEWYYGGTKDKSACRTRFLTDRKCRVFVMNSEAGGTGNDGLQKVARYMVFYETPTPPNTRKQTIKRIHRPGQTERCYIYDLVMRRTIDKGILEDIQAGIDTHDRVTNGQLPTKFLR